MSSSRKIRIGILISGRGSNMEALIKAAARRGYPASIAAVISNRPDAPGLAIAKRYRIPTHIVDHTQFGRRRAFEKEVDRLLSEARVQFVCLAGFMRILSPFFVAEWKDRIVNIHPSLLPSYPGLNVHERVFADRKHVSGCTVHFVKDEVDRGPPIIRARVNIRACKSPDQIAKRVLRLEHIIYPMAVGLICGGKIEIKDGEVRFAGARHAIKQPKRTRARPPISVSTVFRRQLDTSAQWRHKTPERRVVTRRSAGIGLHAV